MNIPGELLTNERRKKGSDDTFKHLHAVRLDNDLNNQLEELCNTYPIVKGKFLRYACSLALKQIRGELRTMEG